MSDNAASVAAIKKLDLKLRQLKLDQRIGDPDHDGLLAEEELRSGQASAKLRKKVRSGDIFATFEVLLGIGAIAIGLFGLASSESIGPVVSIFFPGLGSIGYAIHWIDRGRLQCLYGPKKLQREIDAIEAEIARHRRTVAGTGEDHEDI